MSMRIEVDRSAIHDEDDERMQDEEQQESSSRGGRLNVRTRQEIEADQSSSSSSAPRRQVKMKGRGFKAQFDISEKEKYAGDEGEFESLQDSEHSDAQKSVEGWILIATNIHEEASEDDIYELFADHGEIKQLHLNLDRRTGYVKGYALIEFNTFKEANSALLALNGHIVHEKNLKVEWAFKKAERENRDRRSGPGQRGSGRKRDVRRRND